MLGEARRAGFHTVTPYLLVREVAPVVSFLEQAFGAAETFRITGAAGGTHCEVRIGDSMVMIGGDVPGGMGPQPASLFLYIEHVDETYRRAMAAGAEPLMEPGTHFGESRGAGVRDHFGNQWFIARHDSDAIT